MSMTASNIRYYTDRERVAYQKISGMNEVLSAKPSDMEKVSAKYPDAVFAIMIHAVNAVLTDPGKTFGGIVPVFR